MPTPLEELSEIIYAKLPELKELKFGCEVIPFGKTKPRRLLGKPRLDSCYTTSLDEEESFKRTDIHKMQILGQPIQLHDVLLSLKGKGVGIGLDVHPLAQFLEWQDTSDQRFVPSRDMPHWNLSVDLDHQSPELHQFLLNLLK